MHKMFTSLGLMSGTSGDGVDASIINTDGIDQFEPIKDKFFEYDSQIYNSIHNLKERINNIDDLDKISSELKKLEREITLFHAKVIEDFKQSNKDFIIGFHGQTIYHNSKEKISTQLGDGFLLNQLTKKKVIYNFRKNDILNGGEGAPLTPIFHQLIATQKNLYLPVGILNIGGISNITIIKQPYSSIELISKDIGPGNCLIDNWVRKNSKMKFDLDGKLAASGKVNEIILEQALELYTNRIDKNKFSFDINDFDISFARGLALEEGAATLTKFTGVIIGEVLNNYIFKNKVTIKRILLCGGGRKNNILIKEIKKNLSKDIDLKLIDDFNINGDFVESQAFGYLAIRSLKGLPITFPQTTKCRKPCTGGEVILN